jgi:hypothetical protein
LTKALPAARHFGIDFFQKKFSSDVFFKKKKTPGHRHKKIMARCAAILTPLALVAWFSPHQRTAHTSYASVFRWARSATCDDAPAPQPRSRLSPDLEALEEELDLQYILDPRTGHARRDRICPCLRDEVEVPLFFLLSFLDFYIYFNSFQIFWAVVRRCVFKVIWVCHEVQERFHTN